MNFLELHEIKNLKKDYILNPLKFRKEVNDRYFIQLSIFFLFQFYEKQPDKKIYKLEIENNITHDIYLFLLKEKDFEEYGLKINSQPQNESKTKKGFYDLKFEHSDWKSKYFTVECKRLIGKNTKNEYPKNIEYIDGMERFTQDDKYSPKFSFGGMLGYVQENKIQEIIIDLKDKIKNTPEIKTVEPEILYNSSVLNFPNTFQSKHLRNNGTSIELLHLFFDFS
jgi:hypothetical protein